MPIYPKLVESLSDVRANLKNHIILKYINTYIDNKILVKEFSNTIDFLYNKAKQGEIETNSVNNLDEKLNKLKNLFSSESSINSNKVNIVNIMNELIDVYLDNFNISISKEEFTIRYDKLVTLLNFTSEEANLTLKTAVHNKPFKIFKSKNNAVVFIGGEEKTEMAVSKEKLISIAFEGIKPQYGSYEPIIIQKIFDNTIFEGLKNEEDFEPDWKNSTTNGQRIKELEEDKDKLYGEIKQLENKVNERNELFENVKSMYEESSSLKAEFENAKNAALSEVKTNASKEFWEEQIEFYSKRYIKYLWIAIISSLLLIGSILKIDSTFVNDTKTEIVKIVEDSQKVTSKDMEKVKSELMSIDFIKYGFMILLISLAIWVIRILMKIALSSYHLSIDAKERVTMINTYLALMKEGNALDENDKKIMIESIFRQTTHGIVKDENSVTVTDIISSFKRK